MAVRSDRSPQTTPAPPQRPEEPADRDCLEQPEPDLDPQRTRFDRLTSSPRAADGELVHWFG